MLDMIQWNDYQDLRPVLGPRPSNMNPPVGRVNEFSRKQAERIRDADRTAPVFYANYISRCNQYLIILMALANCIANLFA